MKHGTTNDPEFDLQMLSASDPAVRANMIRYSVALRFLITGKLRDEDCPGVMFGVNFGSDLDSIEKLKALTRIDGADRVMIGFDVDDPAGPPMNYGLWHPQDGVATFYDRCSPWVPKGYGRALLVAANPEDVAHFRNRPGRTLLRKAGRPQGDLWSGIERARTRLARLVATPAVRNAVGDVYVRIAPNKAEQHIFVIPGAAN